MLFPPLPLWDKSGADIPHEFRWNQATHLAALVFFLPPLKWHFGRRLRDSLLTSCLPPCPPCTQPLRQVPTSLWTCQPTCTPPPPCQHCPPATNSPCLPCTELLRVDSVSTHSHLLVNLAQLLRPIPLPKQTPKNNFQKVMDVSEESYLLALVSALNLTHLVAANSTSSDLAVILEEVPAK